MWILGSGHKFLIEDCSVYPLASRKSREKLIELDMRDSPAQIRNLNLPSYQTESSSGDSHRHGSHVANKGIGNV